MAGAVDRRRFLSLSEGRQHRPLGGARAAAFPDAAGRCIEQGSALQAARGRFVQVVVSVPSTRVATKIARALLEVRLCACAQTLGPITSHYRWKGKIERGREWLLVLKTRATLLEPLEAEVRRLHPYDVPEVLAVPIHSGHAPYLKWLQDECVSKVPRPAQPAQPARKTTRKP